MHILLALLGIVTFVAAWYWRLKMISGAARDGYNAARRFARRPKAAAQGQGSTGLAGVSDPREAATIMMLVVASAGGQAGEQKLTAIRAEMIDHFRFSDTEAGKLLAIASRKAAAASSARRVMARMSDVILRAPAMGPKEFDDLCAMLENVAVADGRVSAAEADLIQIWRRRAGLNVV